MTNEENGYNIGPLTRLVSQISMQKKAHTVQVWGQLIDKRGTKVQSVHSPNAHVAPGDSDQKWWDTLTNLFLLTVKFLFLFCSFAPSLEPSIVSECDVTLGKFEAWKLLTCMCIIIFFFFATQICISLHCAWIRVLQFHSRVEKEVRFSSKWK